MSEGKRPCPTCYGEGILPGRLSRFGRDAAVLVIICGAAAALSWACFNQGYDTGYAVGQRLICPVTPPCPDNPKPVCLTILPRNCGRIGEEKIVCLRNKSDTLRFSVIGPTAVDDPVVIYMPADLIKRQQTDGGLQDER